MKRTLILLILLSINLSCTMKQEVNYDDYQELRHHKGSKNYEVVEIVPEDERVRHPNEAYPHPPVVLFDTITKKMFIRTTTAYLVDIFGNIISNEKINTKVLKDGTNWLWDSYYNWIINGDTTIHNYISPLSEKEEKDPEKWFKKFEELYAKAIDIYIDMGLGAYYFKIDKVWYRMGYNRIANNEFNKKYPEKFTNVRILELKDLSPDYFVPPKERDTSLIKAIRYESAYFEKVNKGFFSYNFSAGWWYLDVYMPGGDTLKIKRYSTFEDPELQLYKIPAEHDGLDDILFIIQQPEEIFSNMFGGMYVIRPRNYKESPMYKQKEEEKAKKRSYKVSYYTFESKEEAEKMFGRPLPDKEE